MRLLPRLLARAIRGALVALAVAAYLLPSLAGSLGASLCFAADGAVHIGCCGPVSAAGETPACCCDDAAPAPRSCCSEHGADAAPGTAPDHDARGRCLKIAPHAEPSAPAGDRTPDLPDVRDLGVVDLLATLPALVAGGASHAARPDARAGPPPGSACPGGFVLRI